MINLLRFDEVFESYSEEFDSKNIMISVFEQYAADFASYLETVCDFTQTPKREIIDIWNGSHNNPSRNFSDGILTKTVRKWIPGRIRSRVPTRLSETLRRMAGRPIDDSVFADDQKSTLSEIFGESNRRFESLTGLDLRGIGYA